MLDSLIGPTTLPKPRHPAVLRAIRRMPELLERSPRLALLAEDVGL